MKKVIVVLLILFIALGLGLFFGISKLGPIVKTAVNTYGPKITKTEVKLEDVNIALLTGTASLKGFYLGNPKGFDKPKAVSVASVLVDIDEGTIMDDLVVIDKVEVVAPDITYEKIKGSDNFQAILKNVKKTVGAGDSASAPAQKGNGGRKLLIRELTIKEAKVHLTMNMLGKQTISAAMPDIHLENIGGENKGASPAEVFEEILASIYGGIKSPEVTDTFNKGLKQIGGGVKAIGDGTKKGLESVTDTVKGFLGN